MSSRNESNNQPDVGLMIRQVRRINLFAKIRILMHSLSTVDPPLRAEITSVRKSYLMQLEIDFFHPFLLSSGVERMPHEASCW